MMPGMDPKMMKQAMKRMGISQEDLPADAVIIIVGGKRLVFDNPEVQKITMQGQDSFQLSGEYREEAIESESRIDEADVTSVMEQTGVDRQAAHAALEETNGDLAAAIIKLSE